jgi:hypothetical protein
MSDVYESSHKCRAGNATCMKRSMQDDVNGPLIVQFCNPVVWSTNFGSAPDYPR